jgi:hypothetical protein
MMVDDQAAYVRLAFSDPADADYAAIHPQQAAAAAAAASSKRGGDKAGKSKASVVNNRYAVALDYESAVAGVVSPTLAHLEADWRNVRASDFTEGPGGAYGGASSSSGGDGEAVLVRRASGKSPAVVHVAGARQTLARRQRMNPCQVLLVKAYNLLLGRQQALIDATGATARATGTAASGVLRAPPLPPSRSSSPSSSAAGDSPSALQKTFHDAVAAAATLGGAAGLAAVVAAAKAAGGAAATAASSLAAGTGGGGGSGRGGRPRVVVSMTTTPGRIGLLGPALDSLAKQSWKPDRVVINVPLWSRRFNSSYAVPPSLAARAPFVQVHRCAEDFGPATKLVPTLSLEPDPATLIITVDDE